MLKTGKEADVHLLSRAVPGRRARCSLAAKRYRAAEHRMFHRDAGYTEGRRVRKSRERRALARRTEFGRELLSGQWAGAEFAALGALWELGAPVPYPVQLYGTELMLEFIGDAGRHGRAAAGPDAGRTATSWPTCSSSASTRCGCSPAPATRTATCRRTTCSSHGGRLVMIDLPQIVDLVANPQGPDFLHRDCENVCTWFARRGLETVEFEHLFGDLMAEAVGAW